MCRFRVPKRLTSYNGTQFASQQLGKLFSEVGIKQVFASVEHPRRMGRLSLPTESCSEVWRGGSRRPKELGQRKFLELCGLTTPLPSPPPERHPSTWVLVHLPSLLFDSFRYLEYLTWVLAYTPSLLLTPRWCFATTWLVLFHITPEHGWFY